MGQEIRRPAED